MSSPAVTLPVCDQSFRLEDRFRVDTDERMIKDMAITVTSSPDGIPTSCNEPSRLARTHPAKSRIVRCLNYSPPTTWRNARLKRPRRSRMRIASACARAYLVTVSVLWSLSRDVFLFLGVDSRR